MSTCMYVLFDERANSTCCSFIYTLWKHLHTHTHTQYEGLSAIPASSIRPTERQQGTCWCTALNGKKKVLARFTRSTAKASNQSSQDRPYGESGPTLSIVTHVWRCCSFDENQGNPSGSLDDSLAAIISVFIRALQVVVWKSVCIIVNQSLGFHCFFFLLTGGKNRALETYSFSSTVRGAINTAGTQLEISSSSSETPRISKGESRINLLISKWRTNNYLPNTDWIPGLWPSGRPQTSSNWFYSLELLWLNNLL